MGTIAARDCLRVLQLTEQVAAAVLLAACQGLELRMQASASELDLQGGIKTTFDEIRAQHPFLGEDRALEGELRKLITRIQQQDLSLYKAGE